MADLQEITANSAAMTKTVTDTVARMSPSPSCEAVMASLANMAAAAICTAPGGEEYAFRFFTDRLVYELERKRKKV